MTNNFEEKKMLLYIANGLSNKNFVRPNVENIAECEENSTKEFKQQRRI